MAPNGKLNTTLKENKDTGFGVNADSYGGRFVNKDGSYNMRKEGLGFLNRLSVFQAMLSMPRWKFISIILVFYFVINLVFAGIYVGIGLNQLQGWAGSTDWARFKEAYFFSTQTFTTVGYGRINPVGDMANFIASLEALSGFLSLAIATGLIYGRFARPKSYLAISHHAIIAPYHGGKAMMFRFVSYKEKHTLTNVEVMVNMALRINENGKSVYRYYTLDLERSKIESLVMNWTVVHPIDEKSPLWGFTSEDMKAADVEVYVLIRGFDDVFSTTVQQRTSYTYSEIMFDRKFKPMYRESEDGRTTILELHRLNEHAGVQAMAE